MSQKLKEIENWKTKLMHISVYFNLSNIYLRPSHERSDNKLYSNKLNFDICEKKNKSIKFETNTKSSAHNHVWCKPFWTDSPCVASKFCSKYKIFIAQTIKMTCYTWAYNPCESNILARYSEWIFNPTRKAGVHNAKKSGTHSEIILTDPLY